MSKKAAGFLVLAAGVGLAVMAMRSGAQKTAVSRPPYLLDNQTTIYTPVPVTSGDTFNWGNRLDDIFGVFYKEGYSPYKLQEEIDGRPYGDERVVPYALDTYKTTSGVSPSLFSEAASMIADAGSSLVSVVSLPRGIRNNNPGNIRTNGGVSQQPFEGAIPIAQNTDSNKSFMQFENPWYGIRAAARVIFNYQDKYKLATIRQFITRYAPPSDDNRTDEYIRSVCASLKIADNVFYNLSNFDNLSALVKLIIFHETSYTYKDGAMFYDACKAAVDNHACPRQWQGRWQVASLLNVLPSYANYA